MSGNFGRALLLAAVAGLLIRRGRIRLEREERPDPVPTVTPADRPIEEVQ